MTQAILSLGDLQVHFAVRGPFNRRIGSIKAVDGVSFDLMPGEVFGLVGESGCGKSTLGKAIMGIHKPTAGEIWFEGQRIDELAPAARRAVRSSLQYAYQDPGASLDPRWKIGSSLHEPLVIHTDLDQAAREKRIRSILEAVGLPDTHLDLYPHEISGGQQRRVGLARILTLHPKVVILDEPTSGLDVSVQATVLSLFRGLRETFDLTYVLISHDLAVIRTMCSRVAVMYLGRIVESGPTEAIFDRPRHPYTRSLVAAIPKIGGVRVTRDFWLQGEPPDPGNLPSGCRFRTRCPKAADLCAREEPALSRWRRVRSPVISRTDLVRVVMVASNREIRDRRRYRRHFHRRRLSRRQRGDAPRQDPDDAAQSERRREGCDGLHAAGMAGVAGRDRPLRARHHGRHQRRDRGEGREDRPAHDRGLQGRARDRPPDAAQGL